MFKLKAENVFEKLKSVFLVAILVVSIAFVLIFVVGNKETDDLNSDLMVIHDSPGSSSEVVMNDNYSYESSSQYEVLDSMKALIERNEDTVGWIKVGDLVDNVVVQGDDNEYYLSRNFDGEYAEAGTIFLDEFCSINPSVECNNIILYGHNQMNGSMFGSLTSFKKDPLLVNEIPYIDFNNNYHSFKFKIIGFFIANTIDGQDDEPVFQYWQYSRFNDDFTFEDFKYELSRRSMVNSDIDFDESDTYITLSTCAVDFDEARFVIVGRSVRNEEDLNSTVLYSKNENAYFPDIYYDLNCDSYVY